MSRRSPTQSGVLILSAVTEGVKQADLRGWVIDSGNWPQRPLDDRRPADRIGHGQNLLLNLRREPQHCHDLRDARTCDPFATGDLGLVGDCSGRAGFLGIAEFVDSVRSMASCSPSTESRPGHQMGKPHRRGEVCGARREAAPIAEAPSGGPLVRGHSSSSMASTSQVATGPQTYALSRAWRGQWSLPPS